MAKYTVNWLFKKDGETYNKGDPIDLPVKVAKPFIEKGVISSDVQSEALDSPEDTDDNKTDIDK